MEPSLAAAPDGLLECSQPAMIAVYLPIVIYGFVGLDIVTDGYLLPAVERLCEWLKVGPAVRDLFFLKMASESAMILAMVASAAVDGGLAVVDFVLDAAIFGLLVNVGFAGISSPVPIQLARPPLVRNAFFAALQVGAAAAVVYTPFPATGVGSWWESLVLLALFGTFEGFVVFGNEPFLAACARFWPPPPSLAAATTGVSLVRVMVDGDGPAGQQLTRNEDGGRPLEQPTDVPPVCLPSISGSGPTVGQAATKAVGFSDGELGRARCSAGHTLRAQSLPLPLLGAAHGGGSVADVDSTLEEPICQEAGQSVTSLGQWAQAVDAHPSRQSGHGGGSSPKATAQAIKEPGIGGDLERVSRSDTTLVRTRSRRLRSVRSTTTADTAAGVSGAAVTTVDEERGGGDAVDGSGNSAEPPSRCLTLLRFEWLVAVAGRLWSAVCLPWELTFRYTVLQCADDRNRRRWPLTLGLSLTWVVAIVLSESLLQNLAFNCAHPLGELQSKLLAIGTCTVRVSVGPRSEIGSLVWLLVALLSGPFLTCAGYSCCDPSRRWNPAWASCRVQRFGGRGGVPGGQAWRSRGRPRRRTGRHDHPVWGGAGRRRADRRRVPRRLGFHSNVCVGCRGVGFAGRDGRGAARDLWRGRRAGGQAGWRAAAGRLRGALGVWGCVGGSLVMRAPLGGGRRRGHDGRFLVGLHSVAVS